MIATADVFGSTTTAPRARARATLSTLIVVAA